MNWHQKLTVRLTFVLILLPFLTSGTMAQATAAKGSSGSCTSQNPGVNVIFAPSNAYTGGLNRIYGDGVSVYNNSADLEFNGGTIYTNGVFNVCSGTNDLTLVVPSGRIIHVDFFEQLEPPAAGAYDLNGQTYPMSFINVHGAYSLKTVGGSLNTCIDSLVTYSNSTTTKLYFNDPTTFTTAGGICPVTTVINGQPSPAVITVTHPDACTWTVHPVADTLGFYRGDIVESVKRGFLSGGQYNLPFAIKLVQQGCTP